VEQQVVYNHWTGLVGWTIKQYSSTVQVGITPKMTRASKIAAQKKQLISILCDEKYLTYTALTLLNPDKTMQQL